MFLIASLGTNSLLNPHFLMGFNLQGSKQEIIKIMPLCKIDGKIAEVYLYTVNGLYHNVLKAIFPMYFTYFFICRNITRNSFPSIYRGRTVSIQPYFINIYTIKRGNLRTPWSYVVFDVPHEIIAAFRNMHMTFRTVI